MALRVTDKEVGQEKSASDWMGRGRGLRGLSGVGQTAWVESDGIDGGNGWDEIQRNGAGPPNFKKTQSLPISRVLIMLKRHPSLPERLGPSETKLRNIAIQNSRDLVKY